LRCFGELDPDDVCGACSALRHVDIDARADSQAQRSPLHAGQDAGQHAQDRRPAELRVRIGAIEVESHCLD
jgi:hypothetical protein